MAGDDYNPAESATLSPIPDDIMRGLYSLTFFGALSFLMATSLFIFITYRFIRWKLIGEAHKGHNQFILLVYNLLLADIQQSMAFLLSAKWIHQNSIEVGTDVCWAQGWFLSTGDISSGVWTLAIALHTWLALVFDYKLPHRTFCIVVVSIWLFVLTIAIIPPIAHPNNVYVRSGVWCWVSAEYSKLRLWCHYFWLFVSMFATVLVYGSLGIALQRRAKLTKQNPLFNTTSSASTIARAARYTFVYPIVYVICALPLAAGRMAAMSNQSVSPIYYCVAGSMISSCGWIDAILYAVTRRKLLFLQSNGPDERFKSKPTSRLNSTFFGNSTKIGATKLPSYQSDDYSSVRKMNSRQGSIEDDPLHDLGGVTQKTTIQITSSPRDPEDIPLGHVSRSTNFDRGHGALPPFRMESGSDDDEKK